MKRLILITLILLASIYWMMCVQFPEIVHQMEKDDLFLFTQDFFVGKMGSLAGLNSWIDNFLLQFYSNVFCAASIVSVLMMLTIAVVYGILRKMHLVDYTQMALWMSAMMLLLFPIQLGMQIEVFVFVLLWLIYICMTHKLIRMFCSVVILLVAFLLLSTPIVWLLMVTCALTEVVYHKGKWFAIVPLVCIALDVLLIQLVSNYISYIPFNNRYLYIHSVGGNLPEILKYVLIYIVLVAVVLGAGKLKLSTKVVSNLLSVVLLMVVTGVFVLLLLNERLNNNERYYKYAALAENKEWDELLQAIHDHAVEEMDITEVRYALLAEAAKGTLADNLLYYPLNNPEDFLFRHDRKAFSCNFNRQFYENLGIYDEAFHQAFEYGLLTSNGNCFSSYRSMIDYAIKTCDFAVAKKYLNILTHSTYHADFVADRMQQIAQAEGSKVKSTAPLRHDDFVGGYPFNSEMIRQLQVEPQNKTRLDYLLCGLLMHKQLEKFAIIMHAFPLYKDKPLPKLYAEASSLIQSMGGQMKDMFSYDANYDQQFGAFYQAYKNKNYDVSNQFGNTYWNYYFYLPAPNEAEIYSTEGH